MFNGHKAGRKGGKTILGKEGTGEREVGKAVELVANESCVMSCCKEREMAMAAGAECDSGNLVGVMCSYDMGWQKREKAHNSSTGHGAVLGVATGKVLDFATRNKTCRTCAASKKDNKLTSHDCWKIIVDLQK